MVEAKEYQVDDFRPAVVYRIEVLDDKHEPIKQASFTVTIDRGASQDVTTDGAGVMNINADGPAAQIKLAAG